MSHHQKNKDELTLIHFGLDYLVLMLGYSDDAPASIRFMDSIFSIPHNDTNAAEILNLSWGESDEEVNIHFGMVNNDEVAYIFRGEDKIMSIQKIGLRSTMPIRVREKYKYRLSFYSAFFSLVRLGTFSYRDYWNLFLYDVETSIITHSVSRIDICADLSGVSVNKVRKSIVTHGVKVKKPSLINIDTVTKEPETFYFGEQSHHWKARVYNKLVEVEKKGKERLYPDYFSYNRVTRLEVELRSRSCQTFGVDLFSCLQLEHLFSVFKAHLINKSSTWRIVKSIEAQIRKKGFNPIEPTRKKFEYESLTNRAFFKATLKKNIACAKRHGISTEELLEHMKKLSKHIPTKMD